MVGALGYESWRTLTVNRRYLVGEGADQPPGSKFSIPHRTGCHERFVLLTVGDLVFIDHSIVEGYVGMALAGGIAAIGTLVVAGLIRRAARK